MFQVPEFRRLEGLKHCMFQSFGLFSGSLKDKTCRFGFQTPRQNTDFCQSRDFRDLVPFVLPAGTEITDFGIQRPAARRPKLETLNVSTFGRFSREFERQNLQF